MVELGDAGRTNQAYWLGAMTRLTGLEWIEHQTPRQNLRLAVGAIAGGSTAGPGRSTSVYPLVLTNSSYVKSSTPIECHNASTRSVAANAPYPIARDQRSGKWFANFPGASTGGAAASVEWAQASYNWNNNLGAMPFVTSKEITSRTSTNATSTNVPVWLPRTGAGDPNVVAGDVIPFLLDGAGARVCCGDYLQAKILSVEMFTGTTNDIGAGWGLMDGVQNSTANGGSGIAMAAGSDRFFPRAAGTGGEVGGSSGSSLYNLNLSGNTTTAGIGALVCSSHQVDAAFTTSTEHLGSTSMQTELANTGISLAEHDHSMTGTTYVSQSSSDVIVYKDDTPDMSSAASTVIDPGHRHSIKSTDVLHSHTGSFSTRHNHTIASTVHSHAWAASTSVPTIPPFKSLLFKERLNNASTL